MGRTAGGRRVPPVLTPVLAPTARAPRCPYVRRTGSTTECLEGRTRLDRAHATAVHRRQARRPNRHRGTSGAPP